MKQPGGIEYLPRLLRGNMRGILITLLAGLLLACSASFGTLPGPTPPSAPPTSLPATLPALATAAPALPACLPDSASPQTATVTGIVDGDTIEVAIGGKAYTVRYVGIDTPETKAPNTPVQFYGPEAARRNATLVDGKMVTLVRDVSDTDRYGRLLRYVLVGDMFVNETLVREGYAASIAYSPDTTCQALLNAAQAQAAAEKIGIWSDPARATPLPLPTTIPAPSEGGCPEGCLVEKTGCPIKGNVNSQGEKIYHAPGSGSYANTRIDPAKGERWFCTVEEAVQNGWRAPAE